MLQSIVYVACCLLWCMLLPRQPSLVSLSLTFRKKDGEGSGELLQAWCLHIDLHMLSRKWLP